MSADVLERRRRAAVLGAGVIGASWAALFLDHGLDVVVHDPAPNAEARVLELLTGLLEGQDWRPRLRFAPSLADAVATADVVQENGPDRIAFKRELWPQVEVAAPVGALLLSSSSGLTATRQSKAMAEPGRLLVGHPFNPPHILPLVEVVPSPATPAALADEAVAFYRALGKHAVLIHKEVPGFAANRLQAAFLRECFWLVRSGAVTPEQIDEIVTRSLGPRWAADGPFASAAMGGGPGGFPAFLEHFGSGLQGLFLHTRLRPVILHPWLRRSLSQKVARSPAGRPVAEQEQARDRKLLAILDALEKTP